MSVKQVIVMRKDLNMRKGKIAAQAAHASMKTILETGNWFETGIVIPVMIGTAIREWLSGTFTKICLYVNSEEELNDIYQKAKDNGLMCSMIVDNGLTEFNGVPTKTCIGIGPDFSENIDKITGHLPLY